MRIQNQLIKKSSRNNICIIKSYFEIYLKQGSGNWLNVD